MFVAPKPTEVNTSSNLFSSDRVAPATKKSTVMDPNTVLTDLTVPVNNSTQPIEQDSFIKGFVGGLKGALANPVTVTSGRDKLAIADPYAKVITTPTNKLTTLLTKYFGETGAVIGGISQNKDIQKMGLELLKTGKVSKETSNLFLKNVSNNVLSGVSTLTTPFVNDFIKNTVLDVKGVDTQSLLSSVLGLPGAGSVESVLSKNPTLSMVIKGKEYLTTGNYEDMDGIFKVMENLTSNNKVSNFLDLDLEFKVFNIITKQLMEIDAPDFITTAINFFKEKDTNVTYGSYDRTTNYLLSNLDNAVDTSSLTYMELMIEEVDPYKILTTNPNFVDDFLTNFKLRYDETASAETGVRLNNLLNKIDKDWYVIDLIASNSEQRTYAGVSDLNLFKRISDDAATVFSLADLYVTELTIASSYETKSITQYMKESYPTVAI